MLLLKTCVALNKHNVVTSCMYYGLVTSSCRSTAAVRDCTWLLVRVLVGVEPEHAKHLLAVDVS